MLNLTLTVLIALSMIGFGYKLGYDKREKVFQETPILFFVNGEPVLRTKQDDGVINITIYQKNLVNLMGNE